MELYEKRKAHMLTALRDEHGKLSNQARFIKEFMDGVLEISRRKEKAIVADLIKRGYLQIDTVAKKPKKAEDGADEHADQVVDDADQFDDADPGAGGFAYLLNMNIRSLTMCAFPFCHGTTARPPACVFLSALPRLLPTCDCICPACPLGTGS